jgi:protein-L-isoaspartate(D-aspartate) O-methyltransferase
MVHSLEQGGAIRSDEVRRAFLAVPRERFVAEVAARDGIAAVYRPEVALPTATDLNGTVISSSSAPAIMAPMLEALELRPGMAVLEIGAGTGYNAALLKELVGASGKVTSVDVDPLFSERARRALAAGGHQCQVETGDGRRGWQPSAPFDRIIVTASSDQVFPAWHDQLVEGGLVELPLRLAAGSAVQAVVTLRRQGHRLRSTSLIAGSFMPLRDPAAPGSSPAIVPSVRALSGGDSPRLIASLEGECVSSMSPRVCQLALATLLGPSSRGRVIGVATGGLVIFLTWSNLAELVFCTVQGRHGVGVASGDGTSIAAVMRSPSSPAQLESWGSDHARGLLESHIRRWEDLRCPTLQDLRLTVDYRTDPGEERTRLDVGNAPVVTVDWVPSGS